MKEDLNWLAATVMQELLGQIDGEPSGTESLKDALYEAFRAGMDYSDFLCRGGYKGQKAPPGFEEWLEQGGWSSSVD